MRRCDEHALSRMNLTNEGAAEGHTAGGQKRLLAGAWAGYWGVVDLVILAIGGSVVAMGHSQTGWIGVLYGTNHDPSALLLLRTAASSKISKQ